MSFTEKNLQLEPQLERKRQEMLYKVRYYIQCLSQTFQQTHTHTQAHYEQTHYEQTRAIVRQLVTRVFVHRQYEQLTQMKLAFETRMQRQHDLSEVRSCTRDVLRGSDCKQQMFNVNKVLDCIKHF